MKPHLLYVEDDESLSFVTRDSLEQRGYRITWYGNGREALERIRQEPFDLCILDVMLPEVDGFTIARAIREVNQQVPIIFLTAKSLKEDRLQGLRIGGDDYLVKPFSIEELVLKIEVFLRRSQIAPRTPQTSIAIGNFRFSYENLSLTDPEKKERKLTQREADLLRFLLGHQNEIARRAEILEQVWGENDYFLGRSLDVFISRLRKYLKADPGVRIENVHGVGFRLLTK